MIWGVAILILLLIGIIGVFLHLNRTPDEPEVFYQVPADTSKPPRAEPEFDWEGHEDHAGHDHEDHGGKVPTEEDVEDDSPKGRVPEGAVTTPDFSSVPKDDDPVKAAYKRLEYIKNNPYAWGGVHSERATELIDELMPVILPKDHNEGDEMDEVLFELCQQDDPRVAEVLIAYLCDGGIGWTVMDDALAEIGPPAVPYILPYLEEGMKKKGRDILISWEIFDSLTRIGVQHRGDLGGILDHIIIPKIKEVAADEDSERYNRGSVKYAREALEKLQ